MKADESKNRASRQLSPTRRTLISDFKENTSQYGPMTEMARSGRKPKEPGTRVIDFHTVAVQLPPTYWSKLQEIAKITGMREGRWTTNQVMALLDHINLADLAMSEPQQKEAFALAEAG